MHPILLKLGPLSVKSYGFFLALGILLGVWWAKIQSKKENISSSVIYDFSLYAVLGGIIFARLVFVFLNLKEYVFDPLSIILPRGGGIGGFSYHGAVLGGIIGGIIFCKKNKFSFLKFADFFSPPLSLGLAIGRIGCFFNGCCYGTKTNLPWGIKFPDTSYSSHPTQIYESVLSLFIFFILIRMKRKFSGYIFFNYLILYSSSRFFLEFLRKGVTAKVLFYLTQAQYASILIIVFSLIFMRILGKEKR